MELSHDRPLAAWIRELQRVCSGGPPGIRERMKASLRPLIRCALRSGVGQPPLVDWVRRQVALLEPDPGAEPRDLGSLSRLLCERLMAWIEQVPGAETVAGP